MKASKKKEFLCVTEKGKLVISSPKCIEEIKKGQDQAKEVSLKIKGSLAVDPEILREPYNI